MSLIDSIRYKLLFSRMDIAAKKKIHLRCEWGQIRGNYGFVVGLWFLLAPQSAMRLPDRGVIDDYSQWLSSHASTMLYRAATLSHIMHHVCTHVGLSHLPPVAACAGYLAQNPSTCCLPFPGASYHRNFSSSFPPFLQLSNI